MAHSSKIYNCWHCGGPGISQVSSTYICPRCDVTWRPHGCTEHILSDRIAYCGAVLQVVDFADPATLSSPA
jgi:hypothetical protein